MSQHSLSRQHDWFGRALGQFAQLDAAWLVVLLAYFAVFGGMLVYSDFLPFTFDNNESFRGCGGCAVVSPTHRRQIGRQPTPARTCFEKRG